MRSLPPLSIRATRGFGTWLRERQISLAVSAYQSGRLLLIGTNQAGDLVPADHHFDRCMGLAMDATGGLWLAALNQVWRFGMLRGDPIKDKANDAILVPQASYVTGFLNAHDIAIDRAMRPLIAASQFNCVATTAAGFSFQPVWSPSFIPGYKVGDCCHINGLALKNGKLRYVSMLARSDNPQAWREAPDDGAVVDVSTGEEVASNLAQPHSPRLDRGRLWLLQSGKGAFGYVAAGRFVAVLKFPGYGRGLAFHGSAAFIGVSKPRGVIGERPSSFAAELLASPDEPRCGIIVYDRDKGGVIHDLQFETGADEIYDIAVLPCLAPLLVMPTSKEASTIYIMQAPAP